MAGTFRTRVALATVGMLLLASSTVWADGDARTWAAVKKWTGTVTVRVTYKAARTVDGTSITMSVSRLLNAKVTLEIDKDKTQVDESDIVSWHSTTCEVTGNVQDEARAVGSDGGVTRETWRASGAGDDCELHLAIEAGPDRKAKYSFAPPSAGVNGTMVFEVPGAPAFTQAQTITIGASLGGALVSPDSPMAACCEGPLPADVGPLGRTVTIPGADLPFLTPFGIEANVATAVVEWDLSPDGRGRPTVTLTGCTDVMSGETATVQADGKPGGGSFRWWATPSDPLTLSPLGANASLLGAKPGATTIHVEYTAAGKKAETSKPGSSARVVSINGGAPIPKLGLYDAKGQKVSATRTVPLQVEPAGDLNLAFPLADSSIASVVSHGSTLELQGVQCGTTTIQGQSRCGQKGGPVAIVQVVACDDDVIADLTQQTKDVKHLIDQNIKATAELLNDPAFKTAENIEVDTAKAVFDTAKVLTKVTPVGRGIKTAGKVLSAASTMNKYMKDDMAGVGASAAMQALKTTAVGAVVDVISVVKDLAGAMSSYKQVAAEMGTIVGTGERMKELGDRLNGYMQQFEVLDKRLTTCKSCRQTTTPPPAQSGQPGQSGQSGQGRQPGQTNQPVPPAQPGAGTGSATPGQPGTTPGAGTGGQTGGAGGQPGARGGVALNLGASCQPAAIEDFADGTLGGYDKKIAQYQGVIQDVAKAADLPAPQRSSIFKAATAAIDAFLSESQSFGQNANDFLSGSAGCPGAAKAAIGTIHVQGKAATKKALLVAKPGP